MSLNSCTINEFTVNSLCGRRRQLIIDALRGERAHPQAVHPNTQVPLRIFTRQPGTADQQPFYTELPVLSVSVEIDGQRYSQALDRASWRPVVSVNKLSVQVLEPTAPQVIALSTRIL